MPVDTAILYGYTSLIFQLRIFILEMVPGRYFTGTILFAFVLYMQCNELYSKLKKFL